MSSQVVLVAANPTPCRILALDDPCLDLNPLSWDTKCAVAIREPNLVLSYLELWLPSSLWDNVTVLSYECLDRMNLLVQQVMTEVLLQISRYIMASLDVMSVLIQSTIFSLLTRLYAGHIFLLQFRFPSVIAPYHPANIDHHFLLPSPINSLHLPCFPPTSSSPSLSLWPLLLLTPAPILQAAYGLPLPL